MKPYVHAAVCADNVAARVSGAFKRAGDGSTREQYQTSAGVLMGRKLKQGGGNGGMAPGVVMWDMSIGNMPNACHS